MNYKSKYRFLFAGGGTAGHLFPAVAVAQQLLELKPESEILFVGSRKKVESRVVPDYGFSFKSIWISGFSRELTFNNLLFPLKFFVSVIQSVMINLKYKPRVAIGSGAYVSGPPVWAAWLMGAKIILLEQNSYPGITNRLLEKKANEIHLTFVESKKYFRAKEKLFITGNPVRVNLRLIDKQIALQNFELDSSRKTLLIIGGSGGARNLNKAVANSLDELTKNGIQIIWQTGQNYFEQFQKYHSDNVKVMPFINDMISAFSACDLLVARSGATTIAEVSNLGLPAIFVPSPFVAANHQYMNAKAICDTDAAIMIEDKNLDKELSQKVIETIFNDERLSLLKSKIKDFAKPNAAIEIAKRAIQLAELI